MASRFDTKKYPADVYEQALIAFARPAQVSPGDLRNALLWKYGHLRKGDRIPAVHQKLIAEIQQAWPRIARDLPRAPEQAFAAIDKISGGRTRFITVAFLVHLLSPERVAIVDQHNFRAVNSLIKDVRPTWRGKKQPSKWLDIVLVGAFMNAVIAAWRAQASTSAPTPRKLDQFLMMYGKHLRRGITTARGRRR
jgi:hypothetical protein